MKPLLLALLFLVPVHVDSAILEPISDHELIMAVDATTLLGRIYRGTWEWSSGTLVAGKVI